MIEISDLKGFDFSKKYIYFSKETSIYEWDDHMFNNKSYFYFYKMEVLKNLFSNDNIDVYELYDVLKNKRYFYVSWAILINHGINIEENTIAKKIIEIFNKYFDISFEARFNFIGNLFHLPIEEDITFNDFKNLSKNKFLKYYKKYREDSADLELVDEIFNNQEILEEKLSEFEEYREFVYSRLDDLSNKLSKYINLDDVNLISLFENITFYRGSDEDEQLANRLILKEFGIEDYDILEELDNSFITNKETFDFNTIKNQNFYKIVNEDFKIYYIYFLQNLNSGRYYPNVCDEEVRFYDDVELVPKNLCMKAFNDCQRIPVQYFKDYAINQNHIIDGKGIGVLKFRTGVNDLKKVLEKYDLKKSGIKSVLINRILDNLSIEEINKEFPGHLFILTTKGEEILNDFKQYQKYNNYFPGIPSNFTIKEFIKICEMNSQYDIEDIALSIVMHNWIIIEDENLFSDSVLQNIYYESFRRKVILISKLKDDFPDKAEILFFDLLTNKINKENYFYVVKRLSNSYHQQRKYDEELNFINCYEDCKFNIDKCDSDWLDKRKNILYELIYHTKKSEH